VFARQLFHHSRERVRQSRVRAFFRSWPRDGDIWAIDDVPSPAGRLSEAEYFISIRPSWLPLRQGDRMILEFDQPQRCAHQFGLDQTIPVTWFDLGRLSADVECQAACWTAIFRLGTQSHFLVPIASRSAQFSAPYFYWYYELISAYQIFSPHDIRLRTCPAWRPSDRKRDHGSSTSTDQGSSSSRIFPWSQDFQGLDSTIPYDRRTESLASRL